MSATVRVVLLRDGNELKLVGGKCVFTSDKPVEPCELDYGSLVLVESNISVGDFATWLTAIVMEGRAEFGNHAVNVKGDFESRFDLGQRIVPSSGEYFFSPVKWACTMFRFRLAVQSSIPYPIESRPELPFFPDGRTAWGFGWEQTLKELTFLEVL